MLTMPLAGHFVDKRGPGKVVLVGIALIATGMGTFAYGVGRHDAYVPVLLIGLLVRGMGMGATMMPVSGSAVRGLAPHQVARGSTLITVNQQVAGSIGTAVMSVILTSQFNGSAYVSAASKAAVLHEEAAKRGLPPDPTKLPPRVLAPGFMQHMTNDLSHAYTVVFAVAVGLVVTTFIPASFLPKKPATTPSGESADPVLE
jgi:DHA2 family multidrug resistance protein